MSLEKTMNEEITRKELVAGLIISDRKLLLVNNIKRDSRWEPPGGKREPITSESAEVILETYEQAVKRELYEELSVQVSIGKKLGAYRTYSKEGLFVCHMYLVKIESGVLAIPEAEQHKLAGFDHFSYKQLEQWDNSRGILVPNVIDALEDLKHYL